MINIASFFSFIIADKSRFKLEIPKLPAQLVGTGDLFAATILAWNSKSGSLETAVKNAVNTVFMVIKDTITYREKLKGIHSDPALLLSNTAGHKPMCVKLQ